MAYDSLESFKMHLSSRIFKRLEETVRFHKESLTSLSDLMETYVLPNHFSDYMERSQKEKIYKKPNVMGILGPDHSFTDLEIEPYEDVSSYAWDMTELLKKGNSFFRHLQSSYIPTQVPRNQLALFSSLITTLDQKEDQSIDLIETVAPSDLQKTVYERHLEVALLTWRLGVNHPFNQNLHQWLRENNPYSRGEYKEKIKEAFPTTEERSILRTGFLHLKPFYAQFYLKHHQSYFFALWHLFDKTGIEFDTGLE